MGLDFLPDFFGCLLIFFGLTQLAYFDGGIETARKTLLYWLAVEAIKLFMMDAVVTSDIHEMHFKAVRRS